ncbi:ribonuclease domain-containing protein [Corynebacterium bovis]|uniref:ribonuclease domain-containing protein n=1 Tax=Corynebacterium bovis TaxID=36808 RepID=UPI000F6525B2|nr:ribonuclease domain-containing protein [Corynebacterium bovis]RRO80895.1 ribonuclease [Corynebacterium bovis]RRO81894.1 ribonuclease [Corynebacterium bovis]RRO83372.1 ribonuclease [Corynebacterium bovis]RRO91007.1 ribonuclease [Corynebacterium bovis]
MAACSQGRGRGSRRSRAVTGALAAVAVAALGAFGYTEVTGDGPGQGSSPSSHSPQGQGGRGDRPGQDGGSGGAGGSGRAGQGGREGRGLSGTCPVTTLPGEADAVIDEILAGAPPRHPGDDGKHFGNYEGALPSEASSYYREYTVDTPGARTRGARRIVVGGGTRTDPDVWYYTGDHYASFCAIPDAEDQEAPALPR